MVKKKLMQLNYETKNLAQKNREKFKQKMSQEVIKGKRVKLNWSCTKIKKISTLQKLMDQI
jgi:hypothetical protein